MTQLIKLATSRPTAIYLIVQAGTDDIDYYSMLLAVPAHKEAAFRQAAAQRAFAADAYGQILYYGAGAMTAEDAMRRLQLTST